MVCVCSECGWSVPTQPMRQLRLDLVIMPEDIIMEEGGDGQTAEAARDEDSGA